MPTVLNELVYFSISSFFMHYEKLKKIINVFVPLAEKDLCRQLNDGFKLVSLDASNMICYFQY